MQKDCKHERSSAALWEKFQKYSCSTDLVPSNMFHPWSDSFLKEDKGKKEGKYKDSTPKLVLLLWKTWMTVISPCTNWLLLDLFIWVVSSFTALIFLPVSVDKMGARKIESTLSQHLAQTVCPMIFKRMATIARQSLLKYLSWIQFLVSWTRQ